MIKLKQLGKNIDLINTQIMELGLDALPANDQKMMTELQKPISV